MWPGTIHNNAPILYTISLGMLSIREGWDHYLLILACLYGLWTCGKILWAHYVTERNCVAPHAFPWRLEVDVPLLKG